MAIASLGQRDENIRADGIGRRGQGDRGGPQAIDAATKPRWEEAVQFRQRGQRRLFDPAHCTAGRDSQGDGHGGGLVVVEQEGRKRGASAER